jgi:hypothetical protein
MVIGETKNITLTFDTSIVTDLTANSVTSLKMHIAVGRRVLLKFKKGGGVGYDGDITVDDILKNRASVLITEALSNRLVEGILFAEVWLTQVVNGTSTTRAFDVKIVDGVVTKPIGG